jgi:hypothetical protein
MTAPVNQYSKDSPEYAVTESFSAPAVSDITSNIHRPSPEIASPRHPELQTILRKPLNTTRTPRDRRDLVNRRSVGSH